MLGEIRGFSSQELLLMQVVRVLVKAPFSSKSTGESDIFHEKAYLIGRRSNGISVFRIEDH